MSGQQHAPAAIYTRERTGTHFTGGWVGLQLYYGSKINLNLSHHRPGQALGFAGGWGSQISRHSAHEGGKVVSPTKRPPLPTRIYSSYSFLLEAESTPRPQCGRKDCVNEKFQWHHRKSKPWPSGLQRSASTNCATGCPIILKCINYFCNKVEFCWLKLFSLCRAKLNFCGLPNKDVLCYKSEGRWFDPSWLHWNFSLT